MEIGRIKRPVIIVGSTRSGTKLISRIIGGDPDNFLITEHREKFHIPEDKSGICEEFLWVNNFAYNGWRQNGNPYVRVPLYSEDDIKVMREIYLRAAGDKRLIIKNPQNIMRISFLKKMFPEALYIFCVRNPWEGGQSRLLKGNTNYQLASQKNYDLPDDLLLKSIYSWKESIDLYLEERDENWRAVRYENTVFKTEETVREVFDFLAMRDVPEYFQKACQISKDLKHRYYPVKRAFHRSKYKKEIMDLIHEGCKTFPYEASVDSLPGNAFHYYFFEQKVVDTKRVKTKIIKLGKSAAKKVIRFFFYASGGKNKLYVGPLIFGSAPASGSTLIIRPDEDEKLKEAIASGSKGQRISFMTNQMQYQRLKNFSKVIVMDSQKVPWVLLKNITFTPAERYNQTLTGEIEYIKKY